MLALTGHAGGVGGHGLHPSSGHALEPPGPAGCALASLSSHSLQETKEEKSSYSCPLCEKLCPTQHQLTMHIRQVGPQSAGLGRSGLGPRCSQHSLTSGLWPRVFSAHLPRDGDPTWVDCPLSRVGAAAVLPSHLEMGQEPETRVLGATSPALEPALHGPAPAGMS
ncbi:Ras-responsive element-binding protein 1 [Galemys pyrenaicus]|uniref:Ras-responsive element-binding protein 1 n=1 Tax=Galemys pyrenaicus TaxID=202257 RepID=A0A8J6DNX8_GALPY|nr:Ras-responsive element-binding protein 1 [Galemys pyrenaicus]